MENVRGCHNGISSIHGITWTIANPSNTTDLTLKHMFDISTRLVSEQYEVFGLETIGWDNHSRKYLSLIGDERVVNLQRMKVYVFSFRILYCVLVIFSKNANRTMHGKTDWDG